MRELTADLFISLDGFASGVDQPPYFGYSGPDLESWVRDHLAPPQLITSWDGLPIRRSHRSCRPPPMKSAPE
jgi:hypothetical protein